jgi:ABC-2 type transport system ATP-binding protein
VEAAHPDGHVALNVEAAPGKDIRSDLAAAVIAKGWPLFELRGVSLSLEDIFLELTTDDASHAQPQAAN